MSDRDQSTVVVEQSNPVQVYSPSLDETEFKEAIPRSLFISVRPIPAWKRTVDVLGCLTCSVFVIPALVALGLYIKCVSRGPVFFTQRRLGRGGKMFRICKLRTMKPREDSEASHRDYLRSIDRDAPVEKPDFDKRLIRGGKLIRALSLDELPQIWNVLRGEMSLVGPRPDVLLINDYGSDFELRRFEVLPGITGLWQVSGKNELSFEQMIELDVRYIDQLSLWQDLRILLKTFRVVFSKDNE